MLPFSSRASPKNCALNVRTVSPNCLSSRMFALPASVCNRMPVAGSVTYPVRSPIEMFSFRADALPASVSLPPMVPPPISDIISPAVGARPRACWKPPSISVMALIYWSTVAPSTSWPLSSIIESRSTPKPEASMPNVPP